MNGNSPKLVFISRGRSLSTISFALLSPPSLFYCPFSKEISFLSSVFYPSNRIKITSYDPNLHSQQLKTSLQLGFFSFFQYFTFFSLLLSVSFRPIVAAAQQQQQPAFKRSLLLRSLAAVALLWDPNTEELSGALRDDFDFDGGKRKHRKKEKKVSPNSLFRLEPAERPRHRTNREWSVVVNAVEVDVVAASKKKWNERKKTIEQEEVTSGIRFFYRFTTCQRLGLNWNLLCSFFFIFLSSHFIFRWDWLECVWWDIFTISYFSYSANNTAHTLGCDEPKVSLVLRAARSGMFNSSIFLFFSTLNSISDLI